MTDDTIKFARARNKKGVYVVVVDGEFYVHPARHLMKLLTTKGRSKLLGDGDEEGDEGEATGAAELSGPMRNRLNAKAKPDVRARCEALYRIVAHQPGMTATDYAKLARAQNPELAIPDDVLGRHAVQRALHVLAHIGALEKSDDKHPAYRVT